MDWILAAKLAFAEGLILTACIVLRFGGTSERTAFAVTMTAATLTGLLAPTAKVAGVSIRYGFVAIDLLTLIAFDAIMVRTRRTWPIWLTGIQMAAVFLGIAMLIEPTTLGQYRLIQGKWAYGLMLAMALGSLRRRRLKAHAGR